MRKAHNSGRNHLQNVRDYYASLGHDKAQNIIDEITRAYETGQVPPGGFGAGLTLGGPGGLGGFGGGSGPGFGGPPPGFGGPPPGYGGPRPPFPGPNGMPPPGFMGGPPPGFMGGPPPGMPPFASGGPNGMPGFMGGPNGPGGGHSNPLETLSVLLKIFTGPPFPGAPPFAPNGQGPMPAYGPPTTADLGPGGIHPGNGQNKRER